MAYETTNATGVGTATHVVVGFFTHASNAHKAVTELRASGFTSNQIGAAFRNEASTVAGHEKENWWEKVKDAFRPEEEKETRRDAVVDTSRASLADSTLNADPYMRSENEYEFPGNDFEDSLAGTGVAPARAAYLSRSLRSGGAIVTVSDTDRAAEAEQILSTNGGTVRYEDEPAIDAADSTGQEITDTGYADGSYTEKRPLETATDSVDRMQLFGEVLRVHKDRINRGEVRIRKDVITEKQTIEVPVTREELVLERVAVAGNTPAPNANIGSSQEVRVPLTEDVVRLEKQAVVREEVLVGKRAVEDVATVSDNVQHEELRVDTNVDTPKRTVGAEDIGDLRRRG